MMLDSLESLNFFIDNESCGRDFSSFTVQTTEMLLISANSEIPVETDHEKTNALLNYPMWVADCPNVRGTI